MRTHRCRGVTIIELIVLVFVVAVSMAIVVSVLQSHDRRRDGRRVVCSNNLRNIGLALVNYQASKNRLPNAGTFHDDPTLHEGNPLKSTIHGRSMAPACVPLRPPPGSKVVAQILPDLDNQDMYNAWNSRSVTSARSVPIPLCRVTQSSQRPASSS